MSQINQIRDAVEYGKAAIRSDIAAGVIPASVRTFQQLHDYVDANEYLPNDQSFEFCSAVSKCLDNWLFRGRV